MAPKHVLVVDGGGPSEAPGAFELLRDQAPKNGSAGPLIRAWRQRVGLSQEELAAAISVTFSTVSRWENGHVKPSKLARKALIHFATTCGVPLDWPRTAESPTESDVVGNPTA